MKYEFKTASNLLEYNIYMDNALKQDDKEYLMKKARKGTISMKDINKYCKEPEEVDLKVCEMLFGYDKDSIYYDYTDDTDDDSSCDDREDRRRQDEEEENAFWDALDREWDKYEEEQDRLEEIESMIDSYMK